MNRLWLMGVAGSGLILLGLLIFHTQTTAAARSLSIPPDQITYQIFQLDTGRTPASNLYCDNSSTGLVFFGEETKNQAPGYLGRIDPAGNLTEWAYGKAPISMIRGSDGAMWTADYEGTWIARLDTS